MAEKYVSETTTLRVAFEMAKHNDWKHIQGTFYEYKGDLYDLARADLSKLDKIVGNTMFMVKRGYRVSGIRKT